MSQSMKFPPISRLMLGASVRCSSLVQKLCKAVCPGCQSRPVSATTSTSLISEQRPMTKPTAKIDTRNPFIPASSPVCRAADTALLFSVVLLGVAAVLVALVKGAF